MKKIYKYLLMTIVVSSTMFYSCETFELENLTDPNALSPDKADANLLLNSIQLDYRSSMITFNDNGADLARIDNFFGRNYFENLGPASLNNPWGDLYSGIIPDIANIETLHSPPDNDFSFHIGISKIMEAHLMMLLVDYLGDIVYSQANNPTEFPNPVLDDDQDVYNAALALLDEAKLLLDGASPGEALDIYYDGDVDKWIKFANTLKMRADLTVGNYAAVVAASAVFDSNADDLSFKYGTNVLQPDTRHPDYNNDYRSDGANIYQSNWLMSLMMSNDFGDQYDEFGEDRIPDPRRRYYFYRQNWRTPSNFAILEDVLGLIGAPGDILAFSAAGDAETLDCSVEETPSHLQFTPDEATFCALPIGYWGRAHGNAQGIPPDNFLRTAVGVYPAGGSFDGVADALPWEGSIANAWPQKVGLGNGGGGFGIEPIMLASYVDFMKAEASLQLGDAASAATFIEEGLNKSIEKVMSFAANDGTADLSQVPDGATVAAFITMILDEFNSAPLTSGLDGDGYPIEKDKMDILGEQYFVALYGGSADAFNFIRRTGYPRTLQRSIDPNPGLFPRTFLYPGNEIIANPNVKQRTDLNTKVFWDQGILNPAN
jgi:hypothetical protein